MNLSIFECINVLTKLKLALGKVGDDGNVANVLHRNQTFNKMVVEKE